MRYDRGQCWLRQAASDVLPVFFSRDWDGQDVPDTLAKTRLHMITAWPRLVQPQQLRYRHEQLVQAYPAWTITTLVTSRRLAARCRHPGILWCTDAVVTAEDFWRPLAVTRYYTGVTVCGAEPYNKHELLSAADRVLIVTQRSSAWAGRDRELRDTLRRCYLQTPRGLGWDHPDVVLQYYNQSASGLALSLADRGAAMLAEFQLCGLPIVATSERGALTEICDHEFLRLIPATAAALGDAVEELYVADYDPHAVRDSFLWTLRDHRQRLEERIGPIDWTRVPTVLEDIPIAEWSSRVESSDGNSRTDGF